ncbi:hypothetical protein [Amycolatopsis sp. NPDC051128]|uniref:hypothetical protein n=1 Tax=Amycolatopsis sp. NPDC051128 TaxID=3155412 RepID=UPI00343B6822
MRQWALLVEYELPDDVDQATAFRPLIHAIHELTPHAPSNVTAFVDDAAVRVINAGKHPIVHTVTFKHPQFELIREWIKSHGVNPNDVLMPAHIRIHEGNATFTTVERDENGGIKQKHGTIAARDTTVPITSPWPGLG